MSLLHTGTTILFLLMGILIGYFGSGHHENKIVNSFVVGGVGSIIGFFVYYLGILILGLILFLAIAFLLSVIFGKKIVVVHKYKETKDPIIDVEIIEKKENFKQ